MVVVIENIVKKMTVPRKKWLETWGSLGSFTYCYLNVYVRVHIYMCYNIISTLAYNG